MTIKEAYDKWAERPGNSGLAISTRSSWNKVWRKLDMNMSCADVTLTTLAVAMHSVGRTPKGDQSRAASVMHHVLTCAHNLCPAENPRLTFTFSDIVTAANGIGTTTNKTDNTQSGDAEFVKAACVDDEPKTSIKIIPRPKSKPGPKPKAAATPKKRGRKKGSPKTPGSGRRAYPVTIIDSQADIADMPYHDFTTRKAAAEYVGVAPSTVESARTRRTPIKGRWYACYTHELGSFQPARPARPAATAEARSSVNMLERYTDQQLYDELIRRGYQCDATKRLTPTQTPQQ